nr:hypothetical protein [Tanacetum cinerariifolium]
MDVEVEQDDLNQKFLTSLATEWLMHTIVWRNRSDLDTMSLDDLYNHLKVYESKEPKKTELNSQNMAFISSAKHSSGNEDGNTACVPTTSTNVPTASASVVTISQDTSCAYIASQSSGLPEAPIEFALMANTSTESKVFDNSLCSNDCKKNNDSLNSKITNLTDKLFDAKNLIHHYKLALAQVESRLVEYKEREVKYCEKIRTLEFYNNSNKECIEILKKKLEILKQEKDGVDGKLVGLLIASKDLDNLIKSQRENKKKEGLGYSAVPPPLAQLYSSSKKDLSWTGLPECKDDTVTDYSRHEPNVESSPDDAKKRNPSVSKTVNSPISPKPFVKFVKTSDSQSKSKTDETKTPKKSPVKYAEQYKKTNKKPNVKGNQRNWNKLKSHQLGPDFVMKKKACFNGGEFNHLAYDCRKRVKRGTTRKFSTSSRNFPTANRKFPTASRKFPTGSMKFCTADMGMKRKAVKPLPCWVWKPSQNLSNNGLNNNNVSSQNNIDDKGYWDSGCSRHMTGNISYLSDYEPFDRGYMSFGQGGCKITGTGTIQTGKLEFENVYFVEDLKDFKLLDDANVLLRTPRQHIMYSIDLNNIVPHKDLTCLVAKASADECMKWHRRLGHFNFKTMNKLVRYNLVRGLPTKCFENNHSGTACLKGKQHKASCKSKLVNSVSKPLHTLHMDLFGPTSEMNDFCSQKGIKREFSNARTPQQNGVAERRNRTLIEAARTMLADAKLPVTFWAEAVNTACYVQNRVLVNKSHNKTPYELFNGDEGYFIGYSMSSKAFRVFNKRTKRVEENLHIEFLENKAIEKGAGPNWLFDIDSLNKSMNYVPVVDDHDAFLESSSSKSQDDCNTDVPKSSRNTNPTATLTFPLANQVETLIVESPIPTASSPVPTACFTDSQEPSSETRLISKSVANQEETPSLDNILTSKTGLKTFLELQQIQKNQMEWKLINKFKEVGEQGFIATIHQKTDLALLQFCLFSCFLSQVEPKKIFDALQDLGWVEAMQEELFKFKIQKVWTLVDCPKGIDVKSAFLYGTIDEEVYVMQPPGFQDPEYGLCLNEQKSPKTGQYLYKIRSHKENPDQEASFQQINSQ